MAHDNNNLMDKIVSLCKRRGFVFPGSEIYGGMANSWDYGPLGALLKNNIKNLWWKMFVDERGDMVGLDAAIIMNPRVWKASGHVENFSDPMVDCKKCKQRFRADHVPPPNPSFAKKGGGGVCPECEGELTEAKEFNLMFKTHVGPVEESGSEAYLRPETAQAIFANFSNVLDTTRMRLPFGIAQIGKAFRNEITTGNFLFRTREFEQMEIEYFVRENEWEKQFEYWLSQMKEWVAALGLKKEHIVYHEIEADELAHYSKRTVDVEYKFPFGQDELYGLAYRTDFDLQQHIKHSGEDLSYRDPETGETFVPHVIEPSLGVDRSFLAVLLSAYDVVEGGRSKTTESVKDEEVVLRLPKSLAPVKVAVLPLSKKEPLRSMAHEIAGDFRKHLSVQYDETGSVGKRYRRQDEIGTPYCVTVDFDSVDDKKVTVRDRDTMNQDRVDIGGLSDFLKEKFVV